MQVWSFEADQIQPDEHLGLSDIVLNDGINEFLKQQKDFNKFFIVAPKGLGKTLILKLKSKIIREGNQGYLCIPNGPLVEKVIIEQITLSQDDFSHFEKYTIWQKIWKICITLTICRYLNIKLPEYFEKKLQDAKDLSPILNIIILDWKFFLHKGQEDFVSSILPQLRNIQNQIAIFIDSFDQTLGHFLNNQNIPTNDKNKKQIAINFWSNAQLGLVYAIQEICTQHRHIKVFSSVRQEAFEMDESDMHMQIEDFTCKVKYSKEQLKKIFENNLRKTEINKLNSPKDANIYIKFFGFEIIPHSFVKDYNEHIFDFIYRHTFGRPRELVLIGKRIYEMLPIHRNISSVREKVNQVSHREIFDQFKKEIIPKFDDFSLTKFLSKISVNAFEKHESIKLNKDDFRFYYQLGLIGASKKDYSTNELRQEFREANKFNYKQTVDVPKADYYFIHPAMDDLFINQLNKKYNEFNVIGYQNVFKPNKSVHKKINNTSICHFGVGNFGCGFVLPLLLKTSRKIVLLNRNSKDWSEIINLKIKEVIFSDSNGNDSKFSIIHDGLTINEIESLSLDWKENKFNHLLLISNNEDLIIDIISNCTYFTTSLKSIEGINWFSNIINSTKFDRYISIYPFENDFSLISKLKVFFKGNDKIFIKEVIADRICSDRIIKIDKDIAVVYTTCESYGLAIINDNRKNMPFNSSKLLKGQDIILTSSFKEFSFYQERKFWLFNCVHAILSCFCYVHLKKKNVPFEKWEDNYIHILKELPEINNKIELITQAQVLRILYGLDTSMKLLIFPGLDNQGIFLELFKYGQNILDRISANRDQLIRVLPLKKFIEKYEDRIKELITFYNEDEKYQSIKSLRVFEDNNKYRTIRKVIRELETNLLELSIELIRMK